MLTSAIPVGGAGTCTIENDVRHALAAQQACTLFTQHPRNGVGKIRLSATIRSHHGGNAISKFQPRSVGEGFEPEQFESLQLVQITSSSILDFGFAILD